MTEKYNLNQLRGAYGAGYYAGKKAEEKVTLTFDDFRWTCFGMFGQTEEKEEYDCGIKRSSSCPFKIKPRQYFYHRGKRRMPQTGMKRF